MPSWRVFMACNQRRRRYLTTGRACGPWPSYDKKPDEPFKVLTQKGYFYGKRFIITPVFAHCNNFCRASVADCRFGARKVRNADGAELGKGIFLPPSGR
jgi:hypothetical protein